MTWLPTNKFVFKSTELFKKNFAWKEYAQIIGVFRCFNVLILNVCQISCLQPLDKDFNFFKLFSSLWYGPLIYLMVLYSKNKIRVYSYVNVLFYLKWKNERMFLNVFFLKTYDTKRRKKNFAQQQTEKENVTLYCMLIIRTLYERLKTFDIFDSVILYVKCLKLNKKRIERCFFYNSFYDIPRDVFVEVYWFPLKFSHRIFRFVNYLSISISWKERCVSWIKSIFQFNSFRLKSFLKVKVGVW